MAIMEVVRLQVDTAQAGELAAARAGMLEAFRERAGFVRADLVRVSEGEWLDLIVWASSADFAESRRRGADDERIGRYFAAIGTLLSDEQGELWSEPAAEGDAT